MISYLDILPNDLKEEFCLYLTFDSNWKLFYYLLTYNSFMYLIDDRIFWKRLYERDISPDIPVNPIIMYCTIRSKLDKCSTTDEKLIIAAQYNCRRILEKLLLSPTYTLHKTWHLEACFGLAIQSGHLDLLKFFLTTSDVLYLDSFEALILAIRSHHLHLVKYIISTGFIIKNLFLLEAASSGAFNIFKHLLGLGLSVYSHNNRALTIAATFGHLNIVRHCIEEGMLATSNNSEAFRESCLHNRYEVAKFLLAHGANIHANNDEALRMSVIRGHLDIAVMLLNRGANFNNAEALQYSINFRRKTIMKLLIKRGASIRNLQFNDLCKLVLVWIF